MLCFTVSVFFCKIPEIKKKFGLSLAYRRYFFLARYLADIVRIRMLGINITFKLVYHLGPILMLNRYLSVPVNHVTQPDLHF
jgi:hypothetical protein